MIFIFDGKIRIASDGGRCHSVFMRYLQRERAWQQVASHDGSADGQFVYAVRTTGIYCRPSCPSRRPAPAHVVFFETCAAARAAGYRACKRCQPDRTHPRAAVVAAACHRLDLGLDLGLDRGLDLAEKKTPSLAELGEAVDMSPAALQRLFRQVMGITPRQYYAARQTDRFRRELASSETVASAVYGAGYGSSSRVYEQSNEALGMTPGTLRKQGAGQMIRYAIRACPLGRILVAATERGVCAVAFGDSDEELSAALRRDFARADLERDDDALAALVSTVVGQLREHPAMAALPLDVRATAFQRRVWEALRGIPRGQTRSYSEIAQAIGQPTAVRAVARACAQNPVAVAVPCHRVVGKNRELTGYRWGVERKRMLLEMEKSELQTAPAESLP